VVEDVTGVTGVEQAELRALGASEIVGDLVSGQTASVTHPGGSKYRAYRFAARGGAVDLWVRSVNGDAKAWLLASDFTTLARNDNASTGVSDSHLNRVLTAGTYYVAFKEAGSQPATFSVTLDGAPAVPVAPVGPPPLVSPPSDPTKPRRIFFTRTAYSGDLKTAGGGVDGLDGADRLCTIAAISTNLGGTWKAFISTTQVKAIDRIADVGPWVNLNGTVVFNNKVGMSVGPLQPFGYNERREPAGLYRQELWTGTTRFLGVAQVPNRSPSVAATCGDWTSNGGVGAWGVTDALNVDWMQFIASDRGFGPGLMPCSDELHLLCFEQ
jgi:hypothetical protein